jgi:hypothetical protein
LRQGLIVGNDVHDIFDEPGDLQQKHPSAAKLFKKEFKDILRAKWIDAVHSLFSHNAPLREWFVPCSSGIVGP